MHNAMLNLGGSKMSKSVGNTMLVAEVVREVRPVELRYYLVSSHYRSVMDFSFEALHEAASAYRRIEGYVRRATEVVGDVSGGMLCAEFAEAMDDDLALPAALAALQGVIREGNKLVLDGPSDALRGNLAAVRAMLDVLGLDPRSAPWTSGGGSSDLLPVVDQLVAVALQERAEARTRKDFAAADRIRDRLPAAGIAVEDTPDGPRWTLAEES
jgi:cysteinyl-tRNA synthetase